MIDLHNHILPSIDDGARDREMSEAMIERFARLGYTRLVATPHLPGPPNGPFLEAVQSRLLESRENGLASGITVDLGFEHVISPGMIDRLASGEPTTLAGSRSVLLETPAFSWPLFVEDVLFELQVAGFQPVLAHPERYPAVQQNPELALKLAERGVVLQITTSSLVGTMGKAAQRTARQLFSVALERGALMVLASDAHSDGDRLGQVERGFIWVRENFSAGDEVVDWAAHHVPVALLDLSSDARDQLDRLRTQSNGWVISRHSRKWWSFGSPRPSLVRRVSASDSSPA